MFVYVCETFLQIFWEEKITESFGALRHELWILDGGM